MTLSRILFHVATQFPTEFCINWTPKYISDQFSGSAVNIWLWNSIYWCLLLYYFYNVWLTIFFRSKFFSDLQSVCCLKSHSRTFRSRTWWRHQWRWSLKWHISCIFVFFSSLLKLTYTKDKPYKRVFGSICRLKRNN